MPNRGRSSIQLNPTRRGAGGIESLGLIAMLLGFLAVNIATATRSPVVWKDEVFFTDPAINLASGHGFTSTVWERQGSGDFFAGNVPLYSVLLSFWIRIFGINPTSVRSFSYLFMAAAAWMIWLGTVRSGLISRPLWRLAAIGTILLSNEVTFSYRSARYDSLGILLVSIVFVGFTLASPVMRSVLACACGSLISLTGLQVVIFSVVISPILIRFVRGRMLQFLATYFAGLFVGGCFLALLYWREGVLENFMKMVLHQSSAQHEQAATLSKSIATKFGFFRNLLYQPTLVIGLATIAGLWWAQRGTAGGKGSMPAKFGLAVGIILPLGMTLVYELPVYYVWMVSIPLILCIAATIEFWDGKKIAVCATSAALALIAAIGLPLRLANALAEWPQRDYAPVEQFVSENLTASDRAAIDFGAYYPAKLAASVCYMPPHFPMMTDAEKAQVNVMVIDPSNLHDYCAFFGNNWVAAAALPGVPQHSFLAFLHHKGDAAGYQLTAYRRSGSAP